ncbi:sigma-54 dependent transcriptional regulator [Marinobacterium arenosum]|uniref:sigma-54 dependent transcriptional regulator n=1 Tax=Marinobacterium arenosum TaxID=2862496 RepID=UPI001C95A53C|nr:sigma-54 dependent transcriptional regulator [Marinobacterium arenosum]MBY4678332.1 sigma-54 dependent transcriptional regulator [Marinobacterium arenosum]
MKDLTGAVDEGRALLYLRPSVQQEDLGGVISENGWQVDVACDINHANQLLESNCYRVGLVHVDGLRPQQIPDAEQLFATRDNIAWVALAHAEALQQGQLCRLIHENFVDYFTLPIHSGVQGLISTLGHAYGMACLRQHSHHDISYNDYEMVGTSPAMRKLFVSIRRVAGVDAPVLVTGESGTGKELIARAVHERSPQRKGPFIAVNCGALPDNLINSELFGYEKGAFTGANQRKIGWIEAAEGGSLFLDEIGDLPLGLQVNLLRFLQEGTIQRVGGTESIRVNARVIAATHVNLAQAVEHGRFRQDLFYRLNVLNLNSPPLRERVQDIEVLARFFFNKFKGDAGRTIRGFTRRSLVAMNNHQWPGNVREMINRVRRALVMCEGRRINPVDLGLEHVEDEALVLTLEQIRERAEERAIRAALVRNTNNVSQTARELGVSRVTLYRLLNKYDLVADS